MLIRAATIAAVLWSVQPAPGPAGAVGVLIGIHRAGVDAGSMGEKPQEPPSSGQLRTIWLSIDGGTQQASRPVELPDLLVPRRSGFWRAGLLGTCSESRYPPIDEDKRLGTATEIDDYFWTAPVGVRPRVRLGVRDLDADAQVGPCRARDVYCDTDGRTQVFWIFPEYASLEQGLRPDCGAHPDWEPGYAVLGLDRGLPRASIADALGPGAEERLRAAHATERENAARADRLCGEPAEFDPMSWHIMREPGEWKIEGWTTTHRMCGFGLDFTADIDLFAVTGRHDDRERWQALKARMPQLTDAHFAPGERWILATTETALLLFAGNAPDRPAARIALSDRDRVVMVEWATGANVARWNAEVARVRQLGRTRPIVAR